MISTQIENLSLDDITCLFGQWLPNNIWTSKKTSTVAVASLNKTITPLVWKLCSGQRNETISAVADKGNATFPVGSSLVWTQRGCSWTGSWCQDTRYKHTMSTGIQEYGINTNTNLNVLESDSNGSFFFFLSDFNSDSNPQVSATPLLRSTAYQPSLVKVVTTHALFMHLHNLPKIKTLAAVWEWWMNDWKRRRDSPQRHICPDTEPR